MIVYDYTITYLIIVIEFYNIVIVCISIVFNICTIVTTVQTKQTIKKTHTGVRGSLESANVQASSVSVNLSMIREVCEKDSYWFDCSVQVGPG